MLIPIIPAYVPTTTTLYMTRYDDGTNTDISGTGLTLTEFGSGHSYSGGFYDINQSAPTADYYEVTLTPALTLGDPFMAEMIVQHVSNSNHSLVPIFAIGFDGDDKEFGWFGNAPPNPKLTFDTSVFGVQYLSPSGISGQTLHLAIQFEFTSGTTYSLKAFHNGTQVYTETDAWNGLPILLRVGAYGASTDTASNILEVAARKELKYTTSFTAPGTLDDP